jgi:hypothetical protein
MSDIDDISPTTLIEDFRSVNIKNKLNSVKSINTITFCLGKERTEKEFISFLSFFVEDEETTVIIELLNQFNCLIDSVSQTVESFSVVFNLWEKISRMEENQIRVKSVEIFEKVIIKYLNEVLKIDPILFGNLILEKYISNSDSSYVYVILNTLYLILIYENTYKSILIEEDSNNKKVKSKIIKQTKAASPIYSQALNIIKNLSKKTIFIELSQLITSLEKYSLLISIEELKEVITNVIKEDEGKEFCFILKGNMIINLIKGIEAYSLVYDNKEENVNMILNVFHLLYKDIFKKIVVNIDVVVDFNDNILYLLTCLIKFSYKILNTISKIMIKYINLITNMPFMTYIKEVIYDIYELYSNYLKIPIPDIRLQLSQVFEGLFSEFLDLSHILSSHESKESKNMKEMKDNKSKDSYKLKDIIYNLLDMFLNKIVKEASIPTTIQASTQLQNTTSQQINQNQQGAVSLLNLKSRQVISSSLLAISSKAKLSRSDFNTKILPHVIDILKDDSLELKITLLSKIDDLDSNIISIDELFEYILPALYDISNSKSWRNRLQLKNLYEPLKKTIPKKTILNKIFPIYQSWLYDPVWAIREEAIVCVVKIMKDYNESTWEMMIGKIKELENEKNYLIKVTLSRLISAINENNEIRIFVEKYMFDTVYNLCAMNNENVILNLQKVIKSFLLSKNRLDEKKVNLIRTCLLKE